eukprot:6180545-Pleurochrysis_carterae.AAC.1
MADTECKSPTPHRVACNSSTRTRTWCCERQRLRNRVLAAERIGTTCSHLPCFRLRRFTLKELSCQVPASRSRETLYGPCQGGIRDYGMSDHLLSKAHPVKRKFRPEVPTSWAAVIWYSRVNSLKPGRRKKSK